MSEIDWFQLCAGCKQEKWRHAAGMVSWCSGFEHAAIEPGSTDILDARWCADGVARWDPRIDAHFNMHEGQRNNFQDFGEMPRYKWGERYSWGTYTTARDVNAGQSMYDNDFRTAPGPGPATWERDHRQEGIDLEKLVRFLHMSHLFDEEFIKVMRRRYGLDKDPPG